MQYLKSCFYSVAILLLFSINSSYCDEELEDDLESEDHHEKNSNNYVSVAMIVPPRKKECYYYVSEGNFELDYQVVKGGDLDIHVTVEDPSGIIILDKEHESESTLEVKVSEQNINKPYKVCLDNSRSSNHEKKVYLEIDVDVVVRRDRLQKERFTQVPQNAESLELHLERFFISIESIDEHLRQVEHVQSKFKNLESKDRSIMEDNFTRVNVWSGFQLSVMVAVGLFQVFVIRSLFDERNPLHKFWRPSYK